MSYIRYLAPLYGGCPDYLLTSLQILQNKAARLVTKSSWYTPASTMLKQVGWLNIRQMITYHSLIMIHKAKHGKKPSYIFDRVSSAFDVATRFAESNAIRENRTMKTQIGKESFLPRTIKDWNRLPADIRAASNHEKFKVGVKQWVQQHY